MKNNNIGIEEKGLLNIKELKAYLGIGDTAIRKLLKEPDCKFTVRLGNRLYANKKLLDEWLSEISGAKNKKIEILKNGKDD